MAGPRSHSLEQNFQRVYDDQNRVDAVQHGWACFFVKLNYFKSNVITEQSDEAFDKLMKEIRTVHSEHLKDARRFQSTLQHVQRVQLELDACIKEINTLKGINKRLRQHCEEIGQKLCKEIEQHAILKSIRQRDADASSRRRE